MVGHRVGGVDTLDLPSLDSGRYSDLTSDNMADLRYQGITVYEKNNPEPENIPDQVPQQVNPLNCRS